MPSFSYTPKQELANSITHGLGLILSLAGLPLLLWLAAKEPLATSGWIFLGIYWVSLLMVYANSTFYHGLKSKAAKKIFKVLDHISIYFLIAGTTSFFVIRYVQGSAGSIFLLIQWLLVGAGTIFKIFFTGRFKLLSTLLYLGLGLMALGIIHTLWVNMPVAVFAWILAGGAFYICGTIFYLWKKLYYQHAIWHLFVLGGSISHFIALVNSLGS
jgi:hemolysin III